MKVLMINSVCGIKSTGRICAELAEALEARGHTVKIAYGRGDVPEKYERFALRIGSDMNVFADALSARLADSAGFGSRLATVRFVEKIKSFDPDIIHLHNLHGYYINIDVLFGYLKTCGKKIIWTLHDCWAFTGHCPYFEYAGCGKWEKGCRDCPQKKEYPKSFSDHSERNWQKKKSIFTGVPELFIVTPSEWLAGLAGRSFLNGYPVKVIHNSVDTSVFRPLRSGIKERYGIGGKKLILGAAASWSGRKGLKYMEELSGMLGDGYCVAVIGVSERQKAALPENMLGIPRTSDAEELAKWYSAADVYVNPTLEDNYPSTNIEAIACGTPVITFDSGGSPESARLYGKAVKKGDTEAICRLIRENRFGERKGDPPAGMKDEYTALYMSLTEPEIK